MYCFIALKYYLHFIKIIYIFCLFLNWGNSPVALSSNWFISAVLYQCPETCLKPALFWFIHTWDWSLTMKLGTIRPSRCLIASQSYHSIDQTWILIKILVSPWRRPHQHQDELNPIQIGPQKSSGENYWHYLPSRNWHFTSKNIFSEKINLGSK